MDRDECLGLEDASRDQAASSPHHICGAGGMDGKCSRSRWRAERLGKRETRNPTHHPEEPKPRVSASGPQGQRGCSSPGVTSRVCRGSFSPPAPSRATGKNPVPEAGPVLVLTPRRSVCTPSPTHTHTHTHTHAHAHAHTHTHTHTHTGQ